MLTRYASEEAFRAYLVAGRDQCADETGDDHDLINQQGVEYGGHGMPAVRSKSSSKSGVVMTLISLA